MAVGIVITLVPISSLYDILKAETSDQDFPYIIQLIPDAFDLSYTEGKGHIIDFLGLERMFSQSNYSQSRLSFILTVSILICKQLEHYGLLFTFFMVKKSLQFIPPGMGNCQPNCAGGQAKKN